MAKPRLYILAAVLYVIAFAAGFVASKGRAEYADVEVLPVAYAWGNQLSVYYPAQKKLYVYSELGGNCVFAYTLSTPGGPITRENCKLSGP